MKRDRRNVRHYLVTVGRGLKNEPVREWTPLTRGTPVLLALQQYEAIPPRQLDMIINDLTAVRAHRNIKD